MFKIKRGVQQACILSPCLFNFYAELLFSYSVMSNSLQPRGLQHARLPCSSLSPGVCSNSCPLNWWCYLTIASSVIPFSCCLQSFPASGCVTPFQMCQLFLSGGQRIKASASASVLPMNIQVWFPLGLTGWISLQLRNTQEYFPTLQFKSNNSLVISFLYSPTLISRYDYWTNHSFD